MNSNVITQYKGFEEFQLERKTIIVPYIQREYRWTPAEIKEFLIDMVDMFSKKEKLKNQSIGILYLTSINASKKEYEIIDGQQRLTTILMVAKYLGIEIYTTLKASNKFYNKQLEDFFNDSEDQCKQSPLTKGFEYIKKWFEIESNYDKIDYYSTNEIFETIRRDKFKERFKEFINKDLLIFEYKCENNNEASDIFIKLNSRGTPLSFVDLLKSYLFKMKIDLGINEDDDIIPYIDNISEIIEDQERGFDYSLIETAYEYIVKCYIQDKISKSNKVLYRLIIKFIEKQRDEENDLWKELFFHEWIDFISIFAYFTNENKYNLEIFKHIKKDNNYSYMKDVFKSIKKTEKVDYLPLVVFIATKYYKGHIQFQDAKLVLEKLCLRLASVSIDFFKFKINNNAEAKFDSNALKYKELFKRYNESWEMLYLYIKSDEFNKSSANQIIEDYSKLEDEKEVNKFKTKYNKMADLINILK